MRTPELSDLVVEHAAPLDALTESDRLRLALRQATERVRALEDALATEKCISQRLRTQLARRTEQDDSLRWRVRRPAED